MNMIGVKRNKKRLQENDIDNENSHNTSKTPNSKNETINFKIDEGKNNTVKFYNKIV